MFPVHENPGAPTSPPDGARTCVPALTVLDDVSAPAFHMPDVIVPTVVAAAELTEVVVTSSVRTFARVFGRTKPSDPVSTK